MPGHGPNVLTVPNSTVLNAEAQEKREEGEAGGSPLTNTFVR